VEVRAGAATGAAGHADPLAFPDVLAALDADAREVRVERRVRAGQIHDHDHPVTLVAGGVADLANDALRDGPQPQRAQHADVDPFVAVVAAPDSEGRGDRAAGRPDHLETRGVVHACRGHGGDDERGQQDDERAPQRERPCHGLRAG